MARLRRSLLGACALGVWLAAEVGLMAAPAAAQPTFDLPVFGRTTYSLTSTSLLRYRGTDYDNNEFEDDFLSFYQRFNMALQGEELRAELRLDAFLPLVQYAYDGMCPSGIMGDGRCELAWDIRPERFALRWVHNEWTVEAGDSQVVFGRGVALSFRKVDLLGIDNALRGGHVQYRGQTFNVRLHGGVANPQNQDPLTLAILDDPNDVVIGASGGVNLPGDVPVTTNLHAVRIWFEDSDFTPGTGRAVDIGGWTFEAPALLDGLLSVYVEGNGMRRSETLGDSQNDSFGRAIYGAVQVQTTNLTILAEWKDYQNFLVAPSVLEGNAWRIYNAAPNIEYNGAQRVRGLGNQRGGGLRIDYAFLPGPWSFSVNSVAFAFSEDSLPTAEPFDGIFVTHSWVRLVRRQEYGSDVNWGFNMDLGLRFEHFLHEEERADIERWDLDRWMIHGRAEVTIGSGDHSVDIVAEHRHERERTGANLELRDFQIGSAVVTYSYGIPLAISLGLQWTDFQPGVVEQREDRSYNFLGGLFYPLLEARWTFTPGTFASVFVGQTPGGQLCSGGVCREVPPFEGFRLQFVGRL